MCIRNCLIISMTFFIPREPKYKHTNHIIYNELQINYKKSYEQ